MPSPEIAINWGDANICLPQIPGYIYESRNAEIAYLWVEKALQGSLGFAPPTSLIMKATHSLFGMIPIEIGQSTYTVNTQERQGTYTEREIWTIRLQEALGRSPTRQEIISARAQYAGHRVTTQRTTQLDYGIHRNPSGHRVMKPGGRASLTLDVDGSGFVSYDGHSPEGSYSHRSVTEVTSTERPNALFLLLEKYLLEYEAGNLPARTTVDQAADTLAFFTYGCLLTDTQTSDNFYQFATAVTSYFRQVGPSEYELKTQSLLTQIKAWEKKGIKRESILQLISATINIATLMDLPMQEQINGIGGRVDLGCLISANRILDLAYAECDKDDKELRTFFAGKGQVVHAVLNSLSPSLRRAVIGIEPDQFQAISDSLPVTIPAALAETLEKRQSGRNRHVLPECSLTDLAECVTTLAERYTRFPEQLIDITNAILTSAESKSSQVSEDLITLSGLVKEYFYRFGLATAEELGINPDFPIDPATEAAEADWASILKDKSRLRVWAITLSSAPGHFGHRWAIRIARRVQQLKKHLSSDDYTADVTVALPLLGENTEKNPARVGPLDIRLPSLRFILRGFSPKEVLYSEKLQAKWGTESTNTAQGLDIFKIKLEEHLLLVTGTKITVELIRIISIDELAQDKEGQVIGAHYRAHKFTGPAIEYLQALGHLIIARRGEVISALNLADELFVSFPKLEGIATAQGTVSSDKLLTHLETTGKVLPGCLPRESEIHFQKNWNNKAQARRATQR